MNLKQITSIYFSPTEHTKAVVEMIAEQLAGPRESLDLTDARNRPDYSFTENEAVLVGVPVYGGRVPATAVERFRKLHGRQTPAVLVVTYGNRAYEDALAELKDVLTEQGFRPAAAAAVVAEHNILPGVAVGRPDRDDVSKLRDFAGKVQECFDKVKSNYELSDLAVKGNHPYKEYHVLPMKIKVGSGCAGCGICIKKCPVQAISRTDPKVTDTERCIGCMRCVKVCPSGQRGISRLVLFAAAQKLKKACAGRKEPEFFL